MTRPFAEIIGDPVNHSKSPALHGFWLKQLGIEAEYRCLRVRTDEVAGYFRQRRHDRDWRGCNVTAPLKAVVQPHLTALSPDARAIGAVNTIVPQSDGELLGINTDAHGAMFAMAGLDVKHAVVLGAGGAARAALFALKVMAVERITVVNRHPKRARQALDDLEVEGRVALFGDPIAGDLLINATPLGMTGQAALSVDLDALPKEATVFDMVYAPNPTPLIRLARLRGLRTIDGLSMLIEQGAMAFAAFFNDGPQAVDTPELRAALSR